MSKAEEVKEEEKVAESEKVEGTKEVIVLDAKIKIGDADATITYDKDAFNNFIGQELKLAVDTISAKTDVFFKAVVEDSTVKSVEIFNENENVKAIDIVAPIGNSSKGDSLEIKHLRDEVKEEGREDINVKITNHVSEPTVLRGAASKLRKIN